MKIKFKQAVALVGGLVMLVGGWQLWRFSRTTWVDAGHVGVIYDASGGLQQRVIKPSAVYVGWRQQVYTYPTQLQAAIYTQDPDEGEVRAADGIQITTKDNLNTIFDVAVIYRVKPEDVFTVFNAFGPIPIEEIQSNHIRRAVKEAVNAVGTNYEVFELMSNKREEVSALITKELEKRLAPKGITIETALLGSCYPTSDQLSKMTAKVNSVTNVQIAELNRQLQAIEQTTLQVKAKAQAQARSVKAVQSQGKSLEMLKLELYEQALKKWNGQLPPLEARPGQTLVIGRDLLMQDRATSDGRNGQ